MSLSRRTFLLATAAMAIAPGTQLFAAIPPQRPEFGLGFSLYGLKAVPLLGAVDLCSQIGYSCTELPAMADWPGAPENLSADQRKELGKRLVDRKLRLSAIMENLPLLAEGKAGENNLARLQAAAELGKAISPEKPPLIETVLGGKPGTWEQVKNQFVERLGRWCDALAPLKTMLAIKAHIGNALQKPADLVWLLEQVNSPWLSAGFDYSHFQLQGLELGDCLNKLLKRTTFIHVKDSRGEPGKFQFLLPGEGTIDYRGYFQALVNSRYAGDVVVEVSGQIHSQPGYDGPAAAKKCFESLQRALPNGTTPRG